jgi:cellulose synthase/poly-beta-1,6-N-acetylglucosamine synthase-like glycosyltransferase
MTGLIGALVFGLGFGYATAGRLWVLAPALWRVAPPPPPARRDPAPLSVAFLVPARREPVVIERALMSMLAIGHPRVTVVAVIDDAEPDTLAAARRADDGTGRLIVVPDCGTPPSKGRAMTTALSHVDGDIVGVFDADSVVDPGLVQVVRLWFEAGADVVQMPVRPRWDRGSGWHGLRTFLDYAAFSRGRSGVTTGFVRLSGTAVFFRVGLLERVGGWRPSLTEDFDLGVRLAAAGARVAVVDHPDVATAEEVPHSALGLLRQRIRWHQGFLEVLAGGAWMRLPTIRMRLTALGPLLVPVGRVLVVLGAALLALAWLRGGSRLVEPVLAGAACVAASALSVDCLVFGRIAGGYGVPVTARRLGALVCGAVPFYAVCAAASVLATGRELLGRRVWTTTDHDRPVRGWP